MIFLSEGRGGCLTLTHDVRGHPHSSPNVDLNRRRAKKVVVPMVENF